MAESSPNFQDLVIKIPSGELITIPGRIVSFFPLFKHPLEAGMKFTCEDPFPMLSDVDKEAIEKLIEWTYHHSEDEPDPRSQGLPSNRYFGDDIPKWDVNFINAIDKLLLFRMMIAANYLSMPKFLEYCGMVIGSRLNKMTVEQAREFFGEENDYTAVEEDEIIRLNYWAEDKKKPDPKPSLPVFSNGQSSSTTELSTSSGKK